MTIRVVNSKMNPVQNPSTFQNTGRRSCSCGPAANIISTEAGFEIYMALPGVEKKDVEMTVTQRILHIQSKQKESTPADRMYTIRQFDFSQFSRKFRLDDSIDTNKIEASMENGILKVMLPVKEAEIQNAKSIAIK